MNADGVAQGGASEAKQPGHFKNALAGACATEAGIAFLQMRLALELQISAESCKNLG
jgi:hypothetical protein